MITLLVHARALRWMCGASEGPIRQRAMRACHFGACKAVLCLLGPLTRGRPEPLAGRWSVRVVDRVTTDAARCTCMPVGRSWGGGARLLNGCSRARTTRETMACARGHASGASRRRRGSTLATTARIDGPDLDIAEHSSAAAQCCSCARLRWTRAWRELWCDVWAQTPLRIYPDLS